MPRRILIWCFGILYFVPVCMSAAVQKVTDCGQYPVHQEILSNRIVGGVPTAEKEVPWIASIQRNGVHICGGSLIRTQYILTAAHCVTGVSPKDITVVLGDWNRTAANLHRKEFSVDKIFIHDLYRTSAFRRLPVNDVALIKTENTIELNERIWPICLQLGSAISEKSATVSGWGKLFFNESKTTDILMKVELPLYNNDKCTEIFSQKYPVQTRGTHICAGNVQGGQDACQGDSGGPLFVPDSSGNKAPKWTLIGVVSAGIGCGNEGTLGLYTRVSEFIEWIEVKIGESLEPVDDEEPDTFSITDDINIPELEPNSDEDVGVVPLPDQIANVQATTKSSITSTEAVAGQNEAVAGRTSACMRCVCQASSNCTRDYLKKEFAWLGYFSMQQVYWIDGGRPRINGDTSEANTAFKNCAKDFECSAKAVRSYINRYKTDCNQDGVVNCDDVVMLHRRGAGGCKIPGIEKTEYWKNYLPCRETMNNKEINVDLKDF